MQKVISLRDYINNKDQMDSVKIQTFCRLMKNVSAAIEKEDRYLIKINLDNIKIDSETAEIILPDNIFNNNPEELEKTVVGFDIGISFIADRKSSNEHKKVSFALMILGWYCNSDESSIQSDINVLENFEEYMKKVPEWLHNFFINIFKKMDYKTSFADYYQKNFTDKLKKNIEDIFVNYNLNQEELDKFTSLVAGMTNKLIKEENYDSKFLYGNFEQITFTISRIVAEEITVELNPKQSTNKAHSDKNIAVIPSKKTDIVGKSSISLVRKIDIEMLNNLPYVPIKNEAASSFVLIVAATLALIIIVFIVTISILRYINY